MFPTCSLSDVRGQSSSTGLAITFRGSCGRRVGLLHQSGGYHGGRKGRPMSVPTTKILAGIAAQCAPPLVIYWVLGTRLRPPVPGAFPFLQAVPYLQPHPFLCRVCLWLLARYG